MNMAERLNNAIVSIVALNPGQFANLERDWAHWWNVRRHVIPEGTPLWTRSLRPFHMRYSAAWARAKHHGERTPHPKTLTTDYAAHVRQDIDRRIEATIDAARATSKAVRPWGRSLWMFGGLALLVFASARGKRPS